MRTSFYNFIIENEEYKSYLIYNSFRNSMMEVEPKVIEYFNAKTFDEYENFDIDKADFNTLIEYGFITEMSEEEEKKTVIDFDNKRRLAFQEAGVGSLTLTIMPTNSCNFRCFYCFEALSRADSPGMSEITINKLLQMIEKLLKSGTYKTFTLAWYGGEPLLKLPIILSVQNKIIQFCKIYEVPLETIIVTNGLLLTKETMEKLLKHQINKVQVTLDGSEEIHNKRRRFPESPDKNYETILDNLIQSPNNLHINIRINLDQTNLGEQYIVVKDLEEKCIWPNKKNIQIYLSQIRDTKNLYKDTILPMDTFCWEDLNFRLWLAKEYNQFIPGNKAKIRLTYPSLSDTAACGYGFNSGSFVIDEDGGLYKCWEAVGIETLKLGTIDGFLAGASVEELSKDWVVNNKLKEKIGCCNCNFLPICSFRCPWEFLNHSEINYVLCSKWKYSLENYLLFQYNLYKENPDLIKGFELIES